jgi:hypothetical protein
VFYVKVATRGGATARKGSPRQALDYITDGHDTRRDPGYSDGELAYIARMGEGWKTDLEGGRVPLAGFGLLAGQSDEAKMRAEFEASCLPTGRCATVGYKSITFTLPKEVSLFAEGHREKAREAMNAAIGAALERAFPGMAYTAVGAVHTRNEAGEIHHHAHVLVGKFAVEHATGRALSVNGKRSGNGPSRVRELKVGWKESIEREFKERLGLTIEQRAPNAAPALVMPDGSRLEPLNRASRRQLEKDVAPWYAAPDKSGAVVQRQLRLNAMDDRIFEVAAGGRPPTGWNAGAFRELFPDQVRFIARYEKRVETLKSIGYLTPAGQLTSEFRLHFAIKNGIDTPELQRLRLDLANQNAREARRRPAHRRPVDLSESSDRSEAARRRVERLGLSRDDIRRIQREAEARKPTPERLREIRIDALRRALVQPSTRLPRTKTILRAFTDLQAARIQRIYLLVSGALSFRYGETKKIADKLRQTAERDLFYAKEKRLAQLGMGLRPIFWAVKVAMPREAGRLEKAVERCSRLAYSQEARRITREEISRSYADWRKAFIDRPIAEIQMRTATGPAAGSSGVDPRGGPTPPDGLSAARAMYEKGYAALEALGRPDVALLRKWVGREDDLVRAIYSADRLPGEKGSGLQPGEHSAAVRAGQIGRLLIREGEAPRLKGPDEMVGSPEVQRLAARLHAFGFRSPLTKDGLGALAPVELKTSLDAFRKAGLLDDGPAWTLKAAQAKSLTQDLGRTVERAIDAEDLLIDLLLKRRGPS